jgi:asparagine synthase (glutamine-hydrolysing)
MPNLVLSLANPATSAEESEHTLRVRTPNGGMQIEVQKYADGSAAALHAQRSLASSDDLYWRLCDGTIFVADNFHDAAASLPADHREIDSAAIVDHFLFRRVPGENTYLKGLNRLGAGSSIQWTARAPEVSIRAPSAPNVDLSMDFLEDIEEFLAAEISAAGTAPLVNMLSGGIDSTLIQSFLGPNAESVSATIDCPEFQFERAYALEASALLGTRHHLVEVSENSWRSAVIDSISSSGLPPHHLQTGLIHRLLDAPFNRFINGHFADALFGFLGKQTGIKSFLKRMVQTLLQPTRSRSTSSDSLAGFVCYSDMDLVARLFGQAQVEASLNRCIAYTIARIGAQIPNGVDGQLHLGHWLDFYCDDTISIWRQLGFGRGKELVAPFSGERAMRAALSIPASKRYVYQGRVKYLLKDLLHRRVPAYNVEKPKGHSGLPLHRFAQEGVFESLADIYPAPPYLEGISRALEGTAGLAETRWNFFALSVWHHEVLANRHLRQHGRSRNYGFTCQPPSF